MWVDLLPLLFTLPLLVLSGFFSGSETMLFGLSAADRAELRGRHPAVSERIEALTKDEPRLLVSILMGNTIINCLFFVITSAILLQAELGAAWSAGVATGLLLALVVVGEIIPKALCDAGRVSAAIILSGPLLIWTKLAGPVAATIERTIVDPLARLSGSEAEQDPDAGRRALRGIVEQAAADQVLQSGEAEMLSELMSMPARRVRDAMTPRLRMPMLSHDATRAEAARLLSQQQTPLVTVVGEGPDDVIGFLHAKRFLHRELPTVGHPSALQPVRAIPETATLEDALQAFKRTGSRALIVVDEFGGTEGVLTIEDVAEELVGDLRHHRPADLAPSANEDGSWSVPGGCSIRDLADQFNLVLQETESATVGGYVVEHLGRVPQAGEAFVIDNTKVTITKANQRRIREINLVLEVTDGE